MQFKNSFAFLLKKLIITSYWTWQEGESLGDMVLPERLLTRRTQTRMAEWVPGGDKACRCSLGDRESEDASLGKSVGWWEKIPACPGEVGGVSVPAGDTQELYWNSIWNVQCRVSHAWRRGGRFLFPSSPLGDPVT